MDIKRKIFYLGAISMFLAMCGIEINLDCSNSVDVEIWVRDANVDFYKWFSWLFFSIMFQTATFLSSGLLFRWQAVYRYLGFVHQVAE